MIKSESDLRSKNLRLISSKISSLGNLSIFFASPMVWATGEGSAPAATPSLIESMMPLLLIFAVIYFFFIVPQKKRLKQHQDFLSKIKKGDRVITSGGILGTIEAVSGTFITLEISEGVHIKALRGQISSYAEEKS